jgi:hypothetical protein
MWFKKPSCMTKNTFKNTCKQPGDVCSVGVALWVPRIYMWAM